MHPFGHENLSPDARCVELLLQYYIQTRQTNECLFQSTLKNESPLTPKRMQPPRCLITDPSSVCHFARHRIAVKV